MYSNIHEIHEIQLDHTSRCNLKCAQCGRFINGWIDNPLNKFLDLTLDDYKILLEPFKPNSISLFHCGNFGDAIASPTFNETFSYSLQKQVKKIKITTNGSLRSSSWWNSLAKEGKERLKVTFSIDGLENTNHIYRSGSQWNKVIENVSAFIGAGGEANWDFIEFEHNYHQIDEAKKLATQLGFKSFNVKYTGRFAIRGLKKETGRAGNIIVDKRDNINQSDFSKVNKTYNGFVNYVKETKVSCKFKNENKIFVDMNMKLWPCTWTAVFDFFAGPKEHSNGFQRAIQLYGKEFNDLRKNGWNILMHPFYQDYLKKSWAGNSSLFPRIYACGRTCGEKYEYSSGHGKNKIINILK